MNATCDMLGMELVSFKNQAENDGLMAAMLEYHLDVNHNYWIGLSKDSSDQNYRLVITVRYIIYSISFESDKFY